MSTRYLKVVVTFFLTVQLVVPRSAMAWGDNGHIAVAKIADINLTSKAKTEIANLLGPDVHIYDRKIAMFADTFKFTSPGAHTKPWHFVDIPVTEAKYDSTRDCKNDDCVVFRIDQLTKTLADTTQSKTDRIFALKMLVHLVGDVHQPLHAAQRSANGEGDEGGNKVPVRFLNRREGHLNLHHIWDAEILDENMQEADPEEYGTTLSSKITDTDRTQWTNSASPEVWANESHQQAVDHAYATVPPLDSITANHPFEITQAYYDQARPVVDLQLSKAGVRLAQLLNDALK
jgi:hypothetical protein